MNYKQLKTLYKKEIMDVIRDKKTILTMVVLPVILYPLLFLVIMQVISMISASQQERTYHVAYVNVADDNRTMLKDWIKGDKDDLDYNIKEVESDDPEKDLRDENIDAYITCRVEGLQVIYEVHYLSAVTNSNSVEGMLKEEIESLAKNVAEANVKEKGLDVDEILYPVVIKSDDMSSSESSIGSILGGIIPFLLITAILMGSMYPAIDTTAGEKERGTLETMLTLPIGNIELIMSKFLSVATISIVSVFINILSMGGVAAYMYMTISSLSKKAEDFKLSTFVPAILISVICIAAFALFMSAVVMCVCAFAKSFKEANNYVTPVTLVVMLTGYIGFIPNVELTSKTALIPVANICLLMKSLLVFKYDFQLIVIVLLSNVVYAFISVWFLSGIYNSESILFGESLAGIRLFERRKNIKEGSRPTIQESLLLLVIALLMLVYVGGIVGVKNQILGMIIPQLCMGLLPVLACIYIKGNIKEVFSLNLPKLKDVIGTVILAAGGISGVMLLSNALVKLLPDSTKGVQNTFDGLLEGVSFVPALLLIALLPAVCEELMFRGYMFSAFRDKVKLPIAILFVSLFFGITHLSLVKLLPTMILGVFLAFAAHYSRSIFCSSLLHFINNGVSVFLMYHADKVPALSKNEFGVKLTVVMVVIALICIPAGMLLIKAGNDKAYMKGISDDQ